MKAFLIAAASVSLALASSAAGAPLDVAAAAESQQPSVDLFAIDRRVMAGDYAAMDEAARLPASIAIPYLVSLLKIDYNPWRQRFVQRALRKVRGTGDYLRQHLAQDRHKLDSFALPELIATREAASAVAPYLFDLTMFIPPDPPIKVTEKDRGICGTTMGPDWVFTDAVRSLDAMKLFDSPRPYGNSGPMSNHVLAWQRWAIANGFTPTDSHPQPRVPDSFREYDVPGFLYFSVRTVQEAKSRDTPTAEQQATLNNLSRRVEAGDYAALEETAKLPAAVAIRYLMMWLRWDYNLARTDALKSAFRAIPGYADYLAKALADETADNPNAERAFEALELIATPEAAAVVAPYLFDHKKRVGGGNSSRDEWNIENAAFTLSAMGLPDGPTHRPALIDPSSDLIVAWQLWALQKGYVPKEWSNQLGVPDCVHDGEAGYRQIREEEKRH